MDAENTMTRTLKPYGDDGLLGGRSRRKEYWSFVVFCVAAYFALGWLQEQPHLVSGEVRSGGYPILTGAFGVYSLPPFLCVTVRHLHDTGRSGWWILIPLVPFVGGLVLLYFMVLDSDGRTNLYGAEPEALGAARCGVGSSAAGPSLTASLYSP